MIATENSCRRRLDLSGYWQGTLTLNPEIDVAAPTMIEREFYLPLPWNRQIEDCRWPVPGRELSGIVRPVDNQNFRDIQRKYSEGIIVLRRRVWYRLESGKRVFMVFEGSNYRTEVRVNEQKLCTHDGGHLAFEFETTDALRDGENLVEITVDNFRREDAAPRAQFNWQNYGGVYRPFYLETRPRRFIRHVAIAPGRDRKGWYADLAVQLDAPAKGRLDAQVRSGATTLCGAGCSVTSTRATASCTATVPRPSGNGGST
jgi:beta-galactosidase/beta-glucuronidase